MERALLVTLVNFASQPIWMVWASPHQGAGKADTAGPLKQREDKASADYTCGQPLCPALIYWYYPMLSSFLKSSITEFAVDHVPSCPTVNWYIPTCTGLRCRVDVIIFLFIRITLEYNLAHGQCMWIRQCTVSYITGTGKNCLGSTEHCIIIFWSKITPGKKRCYRVWSTITG